MRNTIHVQGTFVDVDYHLDGTGGLRSEYRVRADYEGGEFDVTGNGWLVFVYLDVACDLFLFSGGEWLPVRAGMATSLAPYSIFRWRKGPGALRYAAFGRQMETPPSPIPAHGIYLVDGDFHAAPGSVEDAKALFRGGYPVKAAGIDESPSALARRAKEIIDATHHEDLSIGDIAQQLGTSHAVLTRQFRQRYLLAPVAYRNQLRVQEATRLLVFNQAPVNETALEVGFQSSQRFHKVYREAMQVLPSRFAGR